MDRIKIIFVFITSLISITAYALNSNNPFILQKQTGFARFSFDSLKMPNNVQNMGLLGINYFDDITPLIYGGVGGYGSITGTQGGLFVLGIGGGLHHELFYHLVGDLGLFVGGGGGHSALVGGGFMYRPQVGLSYQWKDFRLGAHYSYIDFTTGQIHSQQVGVDLDVLLDFYYMYPHWPNCGYTLHDLGLVCDKYFNLDRNDFALLLQFYPEKAGTKDTGGQLQDGTIGLIGAEFDHYFKDQIFWWVQTAGAYRGVHNGFMDLLGGLGLRWPLTHWLAVVPQIGVGAGGGGNVDTGGGVLVDPILGLEVPLTSHFAARLSGGYIWAPRGTFAAENVTAEILYHLNMIEGSDHPGCCFSNCYWIQNWRVQVLNQTYIHPQRSSDNVESSANLVAVQLDQLFTPYFFFSYQGASAYAGYYTGGLASGLVGPGIQSPQFFNNHLQVFGEFLVGAAGGGGLAVGGGAVIEPEVGIHYAFNPRFGLQVSAGQLKALHAGLSTAVINAGLTVSFGTANQ